MERIRQTLGELSFVENALIAGFAWVASHINVCTGIIAFLVVLLQLKVSFYNAKAKKLESEIKQIELDKMCDEE